MRIPLLIAGLVVAAPAMAQPMPYPYPDPYAGPPPSQQLPPEIANGEIVDRAVPVLRALSHAFLDLPVGEVQAAIEDRPVTRADRNRRVRDVAGIDERDVDRGIARNGATLKHGAQSMARALPVIQRALNQAGDDVARALDNLPSPAYPRM
ncbi:MULTISPECIES: hypothetical protein [Sphingomonas]|uniref:hypothetical protein n=1 Tax=Sphingomonas TaxID=13687 RepID=UPI000DEF5B3D|nr:MULTISPECIES: hypothetical protein [Sphingomonas]